MAVAWCTTVGGFMERWGAKPEPLALSDLCLYPGVAIGLTASLKEAEVSCI